MKKKYIRNWYKTAYTTLDFDEVDEYGNPIAVDVQDLLADDNLDNDEAQILRNEGIEQEYNEDVEREEELRREEEPGQEEDYFEDVDRPWEPPDIAEDSPDTSNKVEALRNAIENKRVLEIRYSPAGRGNRAIDFGKSIKRVIEPHNMYQAGNGNTILNTWDRSVGATRAFIVDRIQNIVFRDNASRNPFRQRQYVLPSYERGNAMANTNKSLTKILSKISEKQVQNTKGFNLSKIKNAEEGNGASKKRIDRTVQRARELIKRRQREKENEERYQIENPPVETPADDTDFNLDKARQQAQERGRQLGEERQRAKENEEKFRKKNPEGSNVNSSLIKIASELESNGLSKSAVVVNSVNKVLNQMKKAQYVGFQGQAIRNRRCWDNCYRNKRTETPDKSAQVVWFECWDEYLKSLKNSDKWDKYASIDKLAKDEKWNQKFSKEVKKKIKAGMSIPEAMYDTLSKEDEKHMDMILKQAGDLTELAVTLNSNGYENIAIKVAEASNEILKEAQFGGGWEGAWNKVRRYNPFSSKSRVKGLSGDISTRLKRITQQVLQMKDQFNTIKQQAHQSGQYNVGYQQQQQAASDQKQQRWDKVKAMPGQVGQAVGNAAKQVGRGVSNVVNQIATNPAVQQAGQSFGDSKSDIKTAAPAAAAAAADPNYLAGADEFAIQLRDEFSSLMTNLRNESTSMGQMSTQSKDQVSKNMASQASKRIMEFINKAAPFEQAFGKRTEMITQADALVTEMQNFASDLNMIQMGDFDAQESGAEADPRTEFDTNQDNNISPPEAAASGVDADNSGTITPNEVKPPGMEKEIPTGTINEEYFKKFLAILNPQQKMQLQNMLQQGETPAFNPTPDAKDMYASFNIRGKRILANILNKNRGIANNKMNTI